jgi:phosphatidate cytidylyltransferase
MSTNKESAAMDVDLFKKFSKANFIPRLFSALIMAPSALFFIWMGGYVYIGFIALLIIILAWEWQAMLRKRPHLVIGILGYIYIFICGMALLKIRFIPDGFYIILWLLITIAVTDIAGYLFGVSIGGKKLCPTISPGKTWAGLIGAISCAALCNYIYFNSTKMAISAAMVAIIGQMGDLLESACKRYFGVKDSSNFIPGHGGFLDRMDSLLPVCLAYYSMIA